MWPAALSSQCCCQRMKNSHRACVCVLMKMEERHTASCSFVTAGIHQRCCVITILLSVLLSVSRLSPFPLRLLPDQRPSQLPLGMQFLTHFDASQLNLIHILCWSCVSCPPPQQAERQMRPGNIKCMLNSMSLPLINFPISAY